MRSERKSTPFPPSQQQASKVQRRIGAAALDLIALDHRLGAISSDLTPPELLPAELQAGIGAVRSDLLADAIATLNDLAQLTEADIPRRHAELAHLANRIAGGN